MIVDPGGRRTAKDRGNFREIESSFGDEGGALCRRLGSRKGMRRADRSLVESHRCGERTNKPGPAS